MSNAERWPGQDPATTRPEIIAVGDSIIQNWSYPNPWIRLGFLNHGLGGQTMSDVAEYFPEDVLSYNPRKVLIEGGVNDFRIGKSVDYVVQKRLNTMHWAQDAGIRVYFANIIPFDPSVQGCANMDPVKSSQLNAILANICADHSRCILVDFAASIGPAFDQSKYQDCAHPNALGNSLLDKAWDDALLIQ